LAFGLPVITTPVGGIPDVFVHESNCLLVPTCSSAGIADALERLAGDQALFSSLVEAGYKTAEELLMQDAPVQVRDLFVRSHLLEGH
jgi:glycosyltransferase involved in cell wall biosynthesis